MSQPLLTSSQVLDAKDLEEHTEEVPEWPNPDGSPGRIRLVQLNAIENIELIEAVKTGGDVIADGGMDGMFIILVFMARDEKGGRVFTMEDVERLRKKNFHVINRLQQRCLKLNKTGLEQEVATKKA